MDTKSASVNVSPNVSPKRKREEDKDEEKKRALKKRFKSGPRINQEMLGEIRNLMDEDDADDFDVDLQIAMCKVIREAIAFWPDSDSE
jgi:hypothetical protein